MAALIQYFGLYPIFWPYSWNGGMPLIKLKLNFRGPQFCLGCHSISFDVRQHQLCSAQARQPKGVWTVTSHVNSWMIHKYRQQCGAFMTGVYEKLLLLSHLSDTCKPLPTSIQVGKSQGGSQRGSGWTMSFHLLKTRLQLIDTWAEFGWVMMIHSTENDFAWWFKGFDLKCRDFFYLFYWELL